MLGFTNLDFVALAFFLIAWLGYHAAVELTPAGQRSLNKMMNEYRYRWMEQMVVRENRIVDTTIMASLMNGTAFFASTSLIAIGGVLALLQSTDSVLPVFADLPFGPPPTRLAWDAEGGGAGGDLRLCLLQVRLVVPALQLHGDHRRRGAGAAGDRAARRRLLSRARPAR